MIFLINIALIAAVGFLVWRRGRDMRVGSVTAARWLRIVALIPLALPVGIFLLFGAAEMLSGDLGGAGHLLQVVVAVLLGMLCWMRPLEGGAALFAGATLTLVGLLGSIPTGEGAVISPAIVILPVPQMVSGMLFFIAGMLARGPSPPAPQR